MIPLNGMYENSQIYGLLKRARVPICQQGLPMPVLGLNRHPGLIYNFTKPIHTKIQPKSLMATAEDRGDGIDSSKVLSSFRETNS